MKILVTGCAGFIGYHVVSKLIKNNQDFKFTFRHTNIGNPEYSINSDFLEASDIKTRTVYELKFNNELLKLNADVMNIKNTIIYFFIL